MKKFARYVEQGMLRLATWQSRHRGTSVVVASLIVLACLPLISRLRVNGELTALLPDNVPAVTDLREISRRFGQPATLGVLVTSNDSERNQRFVRALAPRLESLREFGVISVDWNVSGFRRFLEANRHLYADLELLERIRDAARERIDYEENLANPFFVDLEGRPTSLDEALEDLEAQQQSTAAGRYNDFLSDDWGEVPPGVVPPRYYALFLRTATSDIDAIDRLLARARREINVVRRELNEPEAGDNALKVDFGGGIMDVQAEQRSLEQSAVLATIITLILVAAAIILFFRRWIAIPILLLGLLPSVTMVFAAAPFLIDFLSASSAFLSSIIIGNGINPNIVWLARYFEERSRGRTKLEAHQVANSSTWPGTLSASLAAAVAYGSLMVTDFRAFHDFGVLGAIGMIFSWCATYLWTPTLATWFDRSETKVVRAQQEASNGLGKALAFVALARPRVALTLGVLVSVALMGVFVSWARQNPIEYDFRNMQSTRDPELQWISDRLTGCGGAASNGDGIAVLANTPADVPVLVEQLQAYAGRHPRAFGRIHTIDELLPSRQAEKIPVLAELRALMLRALPFIEGPQRQEVEALLPPASISQLVAADLPELVARPYTDLAGQRGAILYVERHLERNSYDGRYIREWTDAVRSIRQTDGSRPAAAGSVPVIADLVEAIETDGPRTVGVSFALTLTLLLFTFRRLRDRVLTYATLLVGVFWMVGCMAAFGAKINFLNFVALPVTFGLGIDYGVNVMRRVVEEEGKGQPVTPALREAILETGGAVTLCSLTTIIGYGALFTSPNQAINSFGLAMSLAEVTCLLAAIVMLPALLTVVFTRSGKVST